MEDIRRQIVGMRGRRDRLEDGREICFFRTYRGMPLGFGKVFMNAAINLISRTWISSDNKVSW